MLSLIWDLVPSWLRLAICWALIGLGISWLLVHAIPYCSSRRWTGSSSGVVAAQPVLAERCWQSGRYLLAGMLWLALIPALSHIFSAAVERTGGARDEANRDRQAVAQKIELARAAEKDAKAVADADELAAKAECATGRKAKCLGLEARADQSRQRLEAARSALAQAGVVPSDPQARRLAAILPVSEEAIQLYQPIILPVSISVLGLLLIAVGANRQSAAWRRNVRADGNGRPSVASAGLRRTSFPLRRLTDRNPVTSVAGFFVVNTSLCQKCAMLKSMPREQTH